MLQELSGWADNEIKCDQEVDKPAIRCSKSGGCMEIKGLKHFMWKGYKKIMKKCYQ